MPSTPATEWAELARTRLADEGHRSGGARDAVVDHLSRQDCCVSAQEITDELSASGGKVGLASVYRALDLLHSLALVQRVDLGDGGLRYEPILPGGEHHHHAVCDRCGRVTAFEDERLEQALHSLADEIKHSINAHEVVIHGSCRRCAAK